MSVRIEPLHALSERARQTLIRELGVVDALRYLSQFRTGGGDYTAERQKLFEGESVEDIMAAIKARRDDGVSTPDLAGDGRRAS